MTAVQKSCIHASAVAVFVEWLIAYGVSKSCISIIINFVRQNLYNNYVKLWNSTEASASLALIFRLVMNFIRPKTLIPAL